MKTPNTRLVAIVIASMLASGALAADRPPRDLKLVGDHWTAWDPPTDIPEGAEVHIIVPGDTLWDLAKRYSGDPYLWPQLWEKNRYILDAHWIYPGDPLVLSIAVTPEVAVDELGADLGSEGDLGTPASDGDGLQLARETSPPAPLGTEDDLYCSGMIAAADVDFERSIIGSEHEVQHPAIASSNTLIYPGQSVRYDLSLGDIVYLDGGRSAGLSPGDLFTVVLDGGDVVHPVTKERAGRLWRFQGRVRVLTSQESVAIAEIVQACGPVRVGQRLKPFEPEPVPLSRRSEMRPANYPAPESELDDAPMILLSKDNLVTLGQDHVVWIDRGSLGDVAPGDVFTIHRKNREGLPPVVIGEVAVLSVQPESALAKIVESRYTVFVGDRLIRK